MSSNFEDRFSKIDINNVNLKMGRNQMLGSSKKAYPNMSPHDNNTRLMAGPGLPFLSTAKRAETRSNNSKNFINPRTPMRNVTGELKISTLRKPIDRRIASCPSSEKRLHTNHSDDHIFSFMKDTTSSMQKKNLSPYNHPVSPYDTTTPSKTPLKLQQPKKNYNDLNPSIKPRRILSHSSTFSPSKPSDITNMMQSSISLKLQDLSDIHESPTKPKARHASLTSKESVYDRLYKPKVHIESRSRGNPMPFISQKREEQQLKKKRYIEPDRTNIKPISNKVENLKELYLIICLKKPDLFNGYSDDVEYLQSTPKDPGKIVEQMSNSEDSLSIYERGEIIRKKNLYFISKKTNTNKGISIQNYNQNFGFDDQNGNYIMVPHDHINYRYEINKSLGKGSFGDVIECFDHKYLTSKGNFKMVAIKIIKNDLNWSLQAVNEIKMLKHLNDKRTDEPILKYYDHFHFRGHMCIVSELLSTDLFNILQLSDFRGFKISFLRSLSREILKGLDFIHKNNILHCDIKPENIMIKLPPSFDFLMQLSNDDIRIRIIDFGSSCFKNEITYSYIQSRFYRAPEILLGAKYNHKIDIWSFGCLLAELYLGEPLLPGKNEYEQIGLMVELFGIPSSSSIKNARNSTQTFNSTDKIDIFQGGLEQLVKSNDRNIKKSLMYTLFDTNGKLNLQYLNHRALHSNTRAVRKQFKPNSRNLELVLRLRGGEDIGMCNLFINFLESIFKWDPQERFSAVELLNHEYIGTTGV